MGNSQTNNRYMLVNYKASRLNERFVIQLEHIRFVF